MRFYGKILTLLWLFLAATQPAVAGTEGAPSSLENAPPMRADSERYCFRQQPPDAVSCWVADQRYPNESYSRREGDQFPRAIFLSQYCNNGHIEACTLLGIKYTISGGDNPNWEVIDKLYDQACNSREPVACYLLGSHKDFGSSDSISLYRKSCDLGFQHACEESDRLRQSSASRSPPVVAVAAPAPQCRTVRGTSDLGEVERVLCMENDGQWRQREARLVTPIPPPVVAQNKATAAAAPHATTKSAGEEKLTMAGFNQDYFFQNLRRVGQSHFVEAYDLGAACMIIAEATGQDSPINEQSAFEITYAIINLKTGLSGKEAGKFMGQREKNVLEKLVDDSQFSKDARDEIKIFCINSFPAQ